MAPPSSDELLAQLQVILDGRVTHMDGFEDKFYGAEIYKNGRAIAATVEPRTTFTYRLTIPDEHSNRGGNMHGGAVAMAFDNLSSSAVSLWALCGAPPGSELAEIWSTSGVSRTLNVSYLRPAPIGSEVDIVSELVSVGKTMALIKGEMRAADTSKVLSTFEHHKVAVKYPWKL